MDECAGLLIRHHDGHYECLDPGCVEVIAIRHEWRTTCDGLGEPCRECTPRVPRHRAA